MTILKRDSPEKGHILIMCPFSGYRLNYVNFTKVVLVYCVECCEDLPKHASCGRIQFRSFKYCDTIYNMLTDVQKKDFHTRAMKYIERKMKRCASCGYREFSQASGSRRKASIYHADYEALREMIGYNEDEDGAGLLYKTAEKSEFDLVSSTRKHYTMFIPRNRIICGLIPVPRVMKKVSVESLSGDYSDIDYSECKCFYILATAFTQLIKHSIGAGLLYRAVQIKLKYAYMCIKTNNIPLAMILLEDAEKLVDQDDQCLNIPLWQYPFIQARLYALLGHAYVRSGDLTPGERTLLKGFELYGYIFPSSPIKLSSYYQLLKIKLKKYFNLTGRARGRRELLFEETSTCLSFMSELFKEKGEWKKAELCALQSLNMALESRQNFCVLVTAYKDVLDVMFYFGDTYNSWFMETDALERCLEEIIAPEFHELHAILLLYRSIFFTRMQRGELARSNSIGYKAIDIAKALNANDVKLQILPLLIQNLILMHVVDRVNTLLQELYTFSYSEGDWIGKAWFHALCVFFHLETGYTILPRDMCEQFYINIEMNFNEKTYIVKEYIRASLWLWYIRNNDLDEASKWLPEEVDPDTARSAEEFVALVTVVMQQIEGTLIDTVRMINIKNIQNAVSNFDKLHFLLKCSKKWVTALRVYRPRYKIFKAYYIRLKHNMPVKKRLEAAAKLAEEQDNIVDARLASHTIRAWDGTLHPNERDRWKKHCTSNNVLSWHEADEYDFQPISYSFPLPSLIF